VTGRVTQTMGGVESFTAIDPHAGFEKLRLPSRYMVCSDGLTSLFDLGELEGAMRGSAMRLAAVIADEAVQRGCEDDCSMVIIDIDEGFAPGPQSPG
jgi:serine/threonine protein phosphatase PrpC